MSLGDMFSLTPADDADTFTLDNPTGCYSGKHVVLRVTNNAVPTGENIVYDSGYTVLGTVAGGGVLSTGGGDKTYIDFYCTSATTADVVYTARTSP
jgi:hypothetical protein